MDLKEVEELARNPMKKIHAIKRYRELTGQDLKESKDAVEHFIDNGYWLGFSSEPSAPAEAFGSSDNPFAEAERYARENRKIHAIKEYRQVTGAGLKESKEAVEHFIETGSWGHSLPSESKEQAQIDLSSVEALARNPATKIRAIKKYREITGQGLKDSKEAIEYFFSKGEWSIQALHPATEENNIVDLAQFRSQKEAETKEELGWNDSSDSFSSYEDVFKSYQTVTNTSQKETGFTQQDILDWMLSESRKQTGIDLSNDEIAMDRFREAAQKAGIELSVSDSVDINLPFLTADHTGPKHFQAVLTADIFQPSQRKEAFNPEASRREVFSALQEMGMDQDNIQEVIRRAEERGNQKREDRESSKDSGSYEDIIGSEPQKQSNDVLQMGLLIAGLLGMLVVMGGLVAYLVL